MDKQETNSSTRIANSTTAEQVYQALVIEDEGRLCKDIPERACNQQPKHFFTHISSLTLSKLADSLVDPKLILSWLLSQLNTSSTVIGFLVPIRDAGALLPQLFFSEWIRSRQQRKWIWASGAAIQGLAALAMVLSVLLLPKQVAGFGILGCLTILAIARSFCSVSYKDVLGKTLSKSTRGTATGSASSIAAIGVISFALLLSVNMLTLNIDTILVLLGLAGILWILAAINFTGLDEQKGSTEGGENAANNFIARIKSVLNDKQFVLFVAIRGLLTATALAPPFMILLVQQAANSDVSSSSVINLNPTATEGVSFSTEPGQLGLLLLASSLASLASSFLWGRLADRSSRKVIILAAIIAAVSLVALSMLAILYPVVLDRWFILPLLLFLLMIGYQGVRMGRSTHLVDMATAKTRANYTAVSNSTIGILLLFGSVFGWLAQIIGVAGVIVIFSLMCVAACLTATQLKEVQAE